RAALLLLLKAAPLAAQDVAVRFLFERQLAPQAHAIGIIAEAIGQTTINLCGSRRTSGAPFEYLNDIHWTLPSAGFCHAHVAAGGRQLKACHNRAEALTSSGPPQFRKRATGVDPATLCLASIRSSQLSYARMNEAESSEPPLPSQNDSCSA